jgi:hypothetical protein
VFDRPFAEKTNAPQASATHLAVDKASRLPPFAAYATFSRPLVLITIRVRVVVDPDQGAYGSERYVLLIALLVTLLFLLPLVTGAEAEECDWLTTRKRHFWTATRVFTATAVGAPQLRPQVPGISASGQGQTNFFDRRNDLR